MMQILIEEFINKQRKREDMLTEDDLRCKLFKFLEENRDFSQGLENYRLHSEIRRYGNRRELGEDELTYRSDLVYVNRNELINYDLDPTQLPSKGFAFNDYKGIIELKLRRPAGPNGWNNARFINLIRDDFEKLKEIKRKTNGDNSFFYVVVFDKKEDIEQEVINSVIEYEQLGFKLFYKYISPNMYY